MTRILDSTAPLDFIAKNGYYQIGDAITVHAGPAHQESSRTGIPIKWHFNDEVYNKVDWRSRLNLPITELYRIRAQQLRDKYDYLILWFSGGADSTTILESFIQNNILLDEIVVVWPITHTVGKYTPNYNTDPSNFTSEWELSLKPKIDWLAKNYPKIHITLIDQFVDIGLIEDFEDTWTLCEKHSLPTIQKQRLLDRITKERSDTYNRVASISGNAPPMISILDDTWLAVYFENTAASAANGKSDYLLDGTPREVEYFYWSPDLPELVREQGHIILEHLNSSPQDRSLFLKRSFRTGHHDRGPLLNWDINEARRQLIKKLVYPNWNPKTFQTRKPTDQYFQPQLYNWFWKNPESNQFLQSWQSAIRSQYSLINSSQTMMSHGINQLLSLQSKMHVIGRLT